jgi:DNA-directed RNA polymerase specialized sigma24 family protein
VASLNILREEEGLSPLAFSRLLEWLDDGVDSQGERYLEMRRRLVSYFDRRNRLSADELADETFNRIGRTLEKSGVIVITPPARYCYVVARYVLLEDFRRERVHVRLDDEPRGAEGRRAARFGEPDEGVTVQEQRLECLDRCLQELKPDQRELVIEYYRDARREKIERRRAMATRLGITMNALGIRACRIRATLESCVEAYRRERRLI